MSSSGRIGIVDQSIAGWSAGASFTRMMLRSLSLAQQERELVFLSRNPSIKTDWKREEIQQELQGMEWNELKKRLDLSVILPLRDRSILVEGCASVGWIPDFQHLYLPELFSEEQLYERSWLTRKVAQKAELTIFSSRSALADFRKVHPELAERGRVARFSSILWDSDLDEDPAQTVRKYHLPAKFVLVANQFWKHKNHAVLPPASALLEKNGCPVDFVLTGLPSDSRDIENTHFSRFLQLIAFHGVAHRFHILGHVPYPEMVNLMRCAALVLQPSLCEGWSTSIEDCKALGRPLLCSELPVHREQAPSAVGFFPVNAPEKLAHALTEYFPQLVEGPDVSVEKESLQAAKERCRSYGETLLAIANEAEQMFFTQSQRDQIAVAQPKREGLLSRIRLALRPIALWKDRVFPFWLRKRIMHFILDLNPKRPILRLYWMKLGLYFQYPPRKLQIESFPSFPQVTLPKIALVTPSFNQAEFLEATIKSVILQNYPNLSYAVMDGGSQDGSRQIIERYASSLAHVSYGPDEGQADAIIKGFSHVEGEIMGYLNSDDLLLPGTLAFVGSYFATHPEIDAIHGNRIVIDSLGKEVGRWILPEHCPDSIRRFDFIPQECFFWRRSVYERCGGIDPSLRFALDWDLILRMMHCGARFAHVPYFLGCFRAHDEQKSQTIKNSVGKDESRFLRVRELGADESKWKVGAHFRRYAWEAYLAARNWEKSPIGQLWKKQRGIN